LEEGRLTLKPRDNNSGGFRLDHKGVVVTGGANGIGRAVAKTFAFNGACVHILDIDREQAEATAKEITGAGLKAASYWCDVSDHASVETAFREVFQRDRVHVLVNSAGIAHVGKVEDTSERDFDSVIQVNVKGVYNCMRACIGHMKENGGGVILNLASIAATAGVADRFAYSASKGAVVSMTYSVAKDYLHHNIRCNCISPARVHTPFVDGFVRKNYPGREQEMLELLGRSQPIGRMANPQEVAWLALFLCSDEAAFVTGTDYPLDGGFFALRG